MKKRLPSLIVSMLVSGVAFAENETQSMELIEVISKKQAYRGNVDIAQLPQSVSVVTSEQLDSLGINNFQHALNQVSAISTQNNFGGLWESFAIRGFAGDENLPSAYLINGFSAGRGYSGLRDVSNIQAIEVLKGPGSALYGRSEPGGTINVITKKPLFDQSGYVQLSLGEHDYQRLEGDYTNGVNDKTAFRVNGAFEKSDSYRDTITTEKVALTPSFLIKVSEGTQLTYELEYANQAIPFDRGIPVLPDLDLPSSRFLGEPHDGAMNVDAIGHQLEISHQVNAVWTANAGVGIRESSLEGYSSDTELSPGRQLLYVDGQTVNRQRRYRDYDATDLSARAELSGALTVFGYTHNLMFGADVYDYELETHQQRYRVAWGAGETTYSVNVFNPMYGQVAPELAATVNYLEQQDAWGVYFQDQVKMTDKLQVLLGARFDRFKQTVENHLANTHSEHTESEFSPRVGAVYSVFNNLDVYASYSSGFRPNSGADYLGNTFAPEKSRSFETGIKWLKNEKDVELTLALFRATKSNILTADPVNSGFSAALGEAQSRGVELDFIWKLTNNTELTSSYAYVDAHTVNDMVNTDWGVSIPADSQLINVPQHSYNMILRHYTQFAGYGVDFGVNVQHVGKRLGETINPDYELPAYTLTNLFANITLSSAFMLQLNIDNALNKHHYTNSYSALWTMPGQPSLFRASITYQF
ncbi:TonB-dependent siderophore receptor [Pseudoalteromonas aurantia]|uniref:Iron complex outermembrane recepter protein n=1 Tax=Pseudoalteromonas aurantia 208 TaxID=1314867 RepID=A0ABR9EHC1_9GAMM|nr:TonB-dependent siderophore receptor [Pseudoalteromonas aurantia]MBE0370401.1 iron complex outermembrane recepter protein [Pseudoalteromonas aurantia 208]